MRDYAVVSPLFWTGETGKRIRKLGPRCQTIALYLVTGPQSNMLGLYYLPIPTLCHETGSPSKGALEALRRLSEAGFAHYDEGTEYVWVVEMARWQIGEQLKDGDNRIKAIKNELEKLTKIPFYNAFLKRYQGPYHLNGVKSPESPSKAPPKPLRSQEQDQEQEQYKEKESSAGALLAGLLSNDKELKMAFDQARVKFKDIGAWFGKSFNQYGPQAIKQNREELILTLRAIAKKDHFDGDPWGYATKTFLGIVRERMLGEQTKANRPRVAHIRDLYKDYRGEKDAGTHVQR